MSSDQAGMETMPGQADMFPIELRVPTVDRGEVRAELVALLATARAAQDAAPWDRRTHRYHRTVFPQMARWLPDNEAAQFCEAFAIELDRIEPMLA